jgi:hypothetical protein
MSLRLLRSAALAAATLVASTPALADTKAATDALRNKIWAGYSEGFAVRQANSAELGAGEYRVYLVTLYAGNTYRFISVGDSNVKDIDLLLTDAQGKELQRDATDAAEAQIEYTPSESATVYVAVFASSLTEPTKSGVALGVTFR